MDMHEKKIVQSNALFILKFCSAFLWCNAASVIRAAPSILRQFVVFCHSILVWQ